MGAVERMPKIFRLIDDGDLAGLAEAIDKKGLAPWGGTAQTPVQWALERTKHWEVCELLISRGANLDCPDHSSKTAIDYFIDNPHILTLERLRYLLHAGANPCRVWPKFAGMLRTRHLCSSVVQLLLDHGCDVNDTVNPPLHIAASWDFLDVAIILLEAGASIALLNPRGKRAIEVARSDNMRALLRSYEKSKLK